MPFVLVSDGKWLKNNGSDFYIEFGGGKKQIQKVTLSDLVTNYSFQSIDLNLYNLAKLNDKILPFERILLIAAKPQPSFCWIK